MKMSFRTSLLLLSLTSAFLMACGDSSSESGPSASRHNRLSEHGAIQGTLRHFREWFLVNLFSRQHHDQQGSLHQSGRIEQPAQKSNAKKHKIIFNKLIFIRLNINKSSKITTKNTSLARDWCFWNVQDSPRRRCPPEPAQSMPKGGNDIRVRLS